MTAPLNQDDAGSATHATVTHTGDTHTGGTHTTATGAGTAVSPRLHPATQLVLLLCGLLLVYGVSSPVVPAAVLLGAAIGAAVSGGLSFRTWALSWVVLAGPMLVMVGIIQGLFYPGQDVQVLWEAGPAAITVEGLAVAFQLWLRVAAMIAVVALFAFGSDSTRVFDGMIALRLPLSLAYICATAMTLVPLFGTRITESLDARAARGWDTEKFLVRVRLMPGIVASLVTTALIQLDQRHDALTQRGFGAVSRPAPAREYPSGAAQRVLQVGAPILTVALVTASLLDLLPLPRMSDLLAMVGAS